MHRAKIGAGVILGDDDDQPGHDQAGDATEEQRQAGIADAGQRAEADQIIDHERDAGKRQDRGRDHALIQRTHDRLAGAELDEEGADDGGDDADAADCERQRHHVQQAGTAGLGEKDRGENHGGDGSDRVGLEQVSRHAGAIADIVTDVVGDGCRVAWIIFRNAGLDLADEIAADVGALGEDTAAKAGEDRDQRRAEAERNQ